MIGSNSVICFGGLRWDCIAQEYSYTSDRYSYALDGALKISATVALLMGGVSIFRAAMLRGIGSVVTRMFKTNDDLLVSLLLQQRGVPILCAPKPKSWIRELPSSQAEHALFRRDVTRRHRAFRHMVRRMGFDPTAGRLTEFLAKPKRILVAGNICPPLPGSEQLDEHLRALCREEASVHLIAPMPASQARRVQGYVDVPYHIHSVTMMEPGGRWDRVLPVRAWREWRVSRGNWNAWRSRLDRATKLLKPTQVLDWQAKSWKDG